MNTEDFKPIGAFIEFTLRPLIEEIRWILEEFDKKGIKITEKNISKLSSKLIKGYISYSVISFIRSIFITVLVCLTAIYIVRS